MNLNPNVFTFIEYYLSKFKTLRIFIKDCNIDLKDDHCIYVILAKLGTTYFVFVSTFHATREDLGDSYNEPTLDSFCDSLIREKDKLLQFGVINIVTSPL
jgi:hypothetical protein